MGDSVVRKGRWKGMKLFYVAVEEGKTCPTECLWGQTGLCDAANYGGMRFSVSQQFYKHVADQIATELKAHQSGIVVRLHVSGDFPDADYADFWANKLKAHDRLHIWGHTHHRGDLLQRMHTELNLTYPDRALIRCSDSYDIPNSAVTTYPLGNAKQYDGVVCPATLTRSPQGPVIKKYGDLPLATCATCAACMNDKVKCVIWPLIRNGVGYAERGQGVREKATSRIQRGRI
jgi:hypothetical protein